MAALNFPASPTISQRYEPGGGAPSYVYRGDNVWQAIGMGSGGAPQSFTLSAGQTLVAVTYQPGAVAVFRGGVRQVEVADFTAVTGAGIVLLDPAVAGEIVTVIPYSILSTLGGLQKDLNGSDVADKPAFLANIGALGAAQAGLRNLLINSTFRVNQRSFTGGALAAGVFGHDRWKADAGGANYAVAAGVMTIASGTIVQVIEGLNIENTGDHVVNWVGSATCTIDGVAKAKGASFTLTAGTNCIVKFAGGTVSKAQLEPGTRATAYESRPMSLEQFLCKRYFRRFQNENFPGWAATGGAGFGTIKLDPPMRSTPSITMTGSTANFVIAFSTTGSNSTSAPNTRAGINAIAVPVQFNVSAVLTTGDGIELQFQNDAILNCDAEI